MTTSSVHDHINSIVDTEQIPGHVRNCSGMYIKRQAKKPYEGYKYRRKTIHDVWITEV